MSLGTHDSHTHLANFTVRGAPPLLVILRVFLKEGRHSWKPLSPLGPNRPSRGCSSIYALTLTGEPGALVSWAPLPASSASDPCPTCPTARPLLLAKDPTDT